MPRPIELNLTNCLGAEGEVVVARDFCWDAPCRDAPCPTLVFTVRFVIRPWWPNDRAAPHLPSHEPPRLSRVVFTNEIEDGELNALDARLGPTVLDFNPHDRPGRHRWRCRVVLPATDFSSSPITTGMTTGFSRMRAACDPTADRSGHASLQPKAKARAMAGLCNHPDALQPSCACGTDARLRSYKASAKATATVSGSVLLV